jgi:hypothetical protein
LVDQAEIADGLALDDRNWWPFLERDGQDWGPPADDATAISELERLHDAGAQFIVFTSCGFWWLGLLPRVRQVLKRARRTAGDEPTIYRLPAVT